MRAQAAVAEPVSLTDPSQRTPLLILGGLSLLLIAAYWDTFTLTSVKWFEHDSLYAAGWIVPLFAARNLVASLGAVWRSARARLMAWRRTLGVRIVWTAGCRIGESIFLTVCRYCRAFSVCS